MVFRGYDVGQLAKRTFKEIGDDRVLGLAAQAAYYFFFSLFPILLFLAPLLGVIGDKQENFNWVVGQLRQAVPGEASALIDNVVRSVVFADGAPGLISTGALLAVWAGSNVFGALMDSLNEAYDVKETRPWWKTRLVAVGLTLALSLLIITALVLVLYGHDLAELVAGKFGLGEAFEWTWKIAQWPVVLAFVALGFALIYYFAPDLEDPEWKWITPGSLIAVALWLLISFAFKAYLSYFNSYSATYGSLGAVIILMLWFYFTGLAILVGGEINSEIEHAAAEAGHPDAKEEGEKAPGDKESGRAAKGSRAAAATTKSREKGSAKTSPTRAARTNSAAAQKRSFSFGKLAVVLGAWALSKVGRGGSARKER